MDNSITRVNTYNNKVYSYYPNDIAVITDDAALQYDSHDSKIWDLHLHSNTKVSYNDRTKCGFCNHIFQSRNKLFHHLGFMNVNTTRCIDYCDTNPPITECDIYDWKQFSYKSRSNKRHNKRKYSYKNRMLRFIKNNAICKPGNKIKQIDINRIKSLLDRPNLQKTIPFYFKKQLPVVKEAGKNINILDADIIERIGRLSFKAPVIPQNSMET